MTTLRLYDTAAREKRVFTPTDPNRVTLYVCGPTVYSYAHIGNARSAVAFDLLRRVLVSLYSAGAVIYARNITDVDDKIIAASRETGAPIDAITEKFTRIYREDMAALGVQAPDIEPTATGHMNQMIAMIAALIDRGAAYAAEGHVLFDVTQDPAYGALSGRDRDAMVAGARVEVAPYKRDPADFVLWKPAADDEPGWDSPFGRGRPGWHIECSAMIRAQLGETIDIHGGGQDLVFPHHENEAAQSRCAHDAPLARYWLHNGFLTMDATKMSKSLGNVKLVHDLLKTYPGEVLRFALLSGQYRQPLDWTDALIAQSKATLDGWYRALAAVDGEPATDTDVAALPDTVRDALLDDLNTPRAFAAVSAIAGEAHKAKTTEEKAAIAKDLRGAGAVLGFLGGDPKAWFQGAGVAGEGPSPDDIDALLAKRLAARKAKDFAKADQIRDDLAAQGVVIEDGPGGSTWRRG